MRRQCLAGLPRPLCVCSAAPNTTFCPPGLDIGPGAQNALSRLPELSNDRFPELLAHPVPRPAAMPAASPVWLPAGAIKVGFAASPVASPARSERDQRLAMLAMPDGLGPTRRMGWAPFGLKHHCDSQRTIQLGSNCSSSSPKSYIWHKQMPSSPSIGVAHPDPVRCRALAPPVMQQPFLLFSSPWCAQQAVAPSSAALGAVAPRPAMSKSMAANIKSMVPNLNLWLAIIAQ